MQGRVADDCGAVLGSTVHVLRTIGHERWRIAVGLLLKVAYTGKLLCMLGGV